MGLNFHHSEAQVEAEKAQKTKSSPFLKSPNSQITITCRARGILHHDHKLITTTFFLKELLKQLLSGNSPKLTPMVSMRFPFSFSQPPKPPHIPSSTSRSFNAAAAAGVSVAVAAVALAGVAVSSKDASKPRHQFLQDALNSFFSNRPLPLWGSLSLNDSGNSVVDSRTGVSFPSILAGSRRLLGVGIRKKSILGLKNIDVYAFGNLIYLHELPIFFFFLFLTEFSEPNYTNFARFNDDLHLH